MVIISEHLASFMIQVMGLHDPKCCMIFAEMMQHGGLGSSSGDQAGCVAGGVSASYCCPVS